MTKNPCWKPKLRVNSGFLRPRTTVSFVGAKDIRECSPEVDFAVSTSCVAPLHNQSRSYVRLVGSFN